MEIVRNSDKPIAQVARELERENARLRMERELLAWIHQPALGVVVG